MKNYKQQIQEYQKTVRKNDVREEAKERTITVCQNLLNAQTMQKQSGRAGYFEFLYEQSRFIKKRWWVFQGSALWYLWYWLGSYAQDEKEAVRLVGIVATIFVILIVPEVWKNWRNGAIEVEQASYYTLRQICAARLLLFAAVDFGIVMVFFAAAYRTVMIPWNDLVINFLLPVNVSCCICFRLLYSKWEKSEYAAVLFCLIWVAVWMMIAANDVLYQRITAPVWGVLLVLTFAYFVFCVKKSLILDERILEDIDGIRI